MKKNAFTLMEILVVIAVLSVVGVLILTTFTQTLRGGNKAQIIGIIKQNGQAVLETMDKTIRDTDSVACVATDGKVIVIVNQGTYTSYRFITVKDDSSAQTYCQSANGCILQETFPRPAPPAGTSLTDHIKNFDARVCNDLPLTPQILTDTNPQAGVSVENGLFIRDTSVGFKDQVSIQFVLKPGKAAPQAVAGQIDPIKFQTTIQLR